MKSMIVAMFIVLSTNSFASDVAVKCSTTLNESGNSITLAQEILETDLQSDFIGQPPFFAYEVGEFLVMVERPWNGSYDVILATKDYVQEKRVRDVNVGEKTALILSTEGSDISLSCQILK